jgi:methylated-DNA-[protein]-cysteine S-methyltransferase
MLPGQEIFAHIGTAAGDVEIPFDDIKDEFMIPQMKALLYYHQWGSPIGKLTAIASAQGLVTLMTEGQPVHLGNHGSCGEEPFRELRAQLEDYFEKRRQTFNLALDLRGTPFQLRTWQALREIPYGQTITYGEQARRMDQAKAVRAVGLANGRNPLPIIIPCHRVIGKNGALTGYSGGLERKRFLLELETGRNWGGPKANE